MKVKAHKRPLSTSRSPAAPRAPRSPWTPLEIGRVHRAAAVLRARGRRADRATAHAGLADARGRTGGRSPAPRSWSPTPPRATSWSTPASTPRSPRSPRRTWAARSPGTRRPELEPGEDLPAQLRARGRRPEDDLDTVVMTHLHFDHASGMAEFAGASFVALRTRVGGRDHRSRTRSSTATGRRSSTTPSTTGRSTSTARRWARTRRFGRTFDLFGDGSVRLAYTPGHSAGHQSVICRLRDRDLVIAGDAIYTLAQLDDAPPPPRPEDPHTWRRSAAGAAALPAPVPPGGDHPGPRSRGPGRTSSGATSS